MCYYVIASLHEHTGYTCINYVNKVYMIFKYIYAKLERTFYLGEDVLNHCVVFQLIEVVNVNVQTPVAACDAQQLWSVSAAPNSQRHDFNALVSRSLSNED